MIIVMMKLHHELSKDFHLQQEILKNNIGSFIRMSE